MIETTGLTKFMTARWRLTALICASSREPCSDSWAKWSRKVHHG